MVAPFTSVTILAALTRNPELTNGATAGEEHEAPE